jgi:hypothetical protein
MTWCPERGEIDRFPERGPKVIDFHTPAHSHTVKNETGPRAIANDYIVSLWVLFLLLLTAPIQLIPPAL